MESVITDDDETVEEKINDRNQMEDLCKQIVEVDEEDRGGRKSTDFEMRKRVFNQTYEELSKYSCDCGNKCIGASTMDELREMREYIWGATASRTPTQTQRKENLYDILSGAYNKIEENFRFSIHTSRDSKFSKQREVTIFILLDFVIYLQYFFL